MDTIELVGAALAGDAVNFKSMFDDMVGARAVERIDAMKPEVADRIFGDQEDSTDNDEEQSDADTEQAS